MSLVIFDKYADKTYHSGLTFSDPADAEKIKNKREEFDRKASIAFRWALGASFFLAGGAVVTTCGSLCFLLPGVNVTTDILLKAYLPSGGAFAIGIACVRGALNASVLKNKVRKELIEMIVPYLKCDEVIKKHSKWRIHLFIEEQFLNKNWSREYNRSMFNDLTAKFPDPSKEPDKFKHLTEEDAMDLGDLNKKMRDALQQANEHINRFKKGFKRWDKYNTQEKFHIHEKEKLDKEHKKKAAKGK